MMERYGVMLHAYVLMNNHDGADQRLNFSTT